MGLDINFVYLKDGPVPQPDWERSGLAELVASAGDDKSYFWVGGLVIDIRPGKDAGGGRGYIYEDFVSYATFGTQRFYGVEDPIPPEKLTLLATAMRNCLDYCETVGLIKDEDWDGKYPPDRYLEVPSLKTDGWKERVYLSDIRPFIALVKEMARAGFSLHCGW